MLRFWIYCALIAACCLVVWCANCQAKAIAASQPDCATPTESDTLDDAMVWYPIRGPHHPATNLYIDSISAVFLTGVEGHVKAALYLPSGESFSISDVATILGSGQETIVFHFTAPDSALWGIDSLYVAIRSDVHCHLVNWPAHPDPAAGSNEFIRFVARAYDLDWPSGLPAPHHTHLNRYVLGQIYARYVCR